MTEFGKNLKEARQKKGWSQRDLAERSHISSSSINRYELEENGRNPSFIHAIRLADALGIKINVLASWLRKDDKEWRR